MEAAHDDAAIWSIVAFATKLPGLSAAHYKDMAARAPPDEEMESMSKGDGAKAEESIGRRGMRIVLEAKAPRQPPSPA